MPTLRRLLLTLALLAVPGAVSACSNATGAVSIESELRPGEQRATLYVGPRKVACSGEGITECLLVRKSTSGQWQYFYDGIEGFAWEKDYTYQLSVAIREIPNPPADGSSRAYRLLKIVEKTAG
ncbi:MAG TPA: DUF4377 domain-containing protein [Longimicrobium sp.]|nr:DUF4377 domain-containing protein [Longimicrobium sp.]